MWRRAFGVVSLCCAYACRAAADPGAPVQDVTAAESLLFETDHFAGQALPTKLEYRFSWTGDKPFDDRVVLIVSDTRHVEADYRSGDRHVNYPSVDGARGNPLLLYFLEDDLREMQRRTHGQADYFRRLIRRAMADPEVKVEAIEVTVAGRRIAAQRIVIEPFRADPRAPYRYPAMAGKAYEFVLAAALPGQIVRIASHVPLANGQMETTQIEWTGSGSI
jgi:hypothetical protein